MIMKPPPPMFPALGCVTASANAVATAASTALPPFARIAAPTSDAGAETETTSPVFDSTAAESRRVVESRCARVDETGTVTLVRSATKRSRQACDVFMGNSGWGPEGWPLIRYAPSGRPAARAGGGGH